jgi:5,10-methylenetetrahydromethanopterin reductase
VRRLASPRLILRSGRQFLPLGQAAVALASTKSIVIGVRILPAGARNVAFAALEIAFLANLYAERLLVGIGHGMADWMRQVGAHPGSPLALLQEYLQPFEPCSPERPSASPANTFNWLGATR